MTMVTETQFLRHIHVDALSSLHGDDDVKVGLLGDTVVMYVVK